MHWPLASARPWPPLAAPLGVPQHGVRLRRLLQLRRGPLPLRRRLAGPRLGAAGDCRAAFRPPSLPGGVAARHVRDESQMVCMKGSVGGFAHIRKTRSNPVSLVRKMPGARTVPVQNFMHSTRFQSVSASLGIAHRPNDGPLCRPPLLGHLGVARLNLRRLQRFRHPQHRSEVLWRVRPRLSATSMPAAQLF